MKIVKVFGIVLAAHIVPFSIFCLVQGCKSTPRRAPEPELATDPTPVAPVSENWSNQGPEPSLQPTPVSTVAEDQPPLSGLTPAERLRASPTRPEDADPAYTAEPAPAPAASPATYTVRSGDSLWRIAKSHGVTIGDVEKANPGLRGTLRPGMIIKLPAGAGGSAPAPAAAPGAAPAPAASAAASAYVVKAGDSLSKIAARNGTTVAALRQANNLRGDTIQIGQSIVIPLAGSASGAAAAATPPPAERTMSVTVMPGETLGGIARRFGITVQELMSANGISDPRKVRAGQTLKIPGFKAAGAAAPAPAATPPPAPPPAPAPAPAAPAPVTAPAQNPYPAPAPVTEVPVEAPIVPFDEPVPAP
jgi:LysM repeat protein